MRTEEAAERAVELYADMIRRICFMHLKKYEDVEDAFQEVFLKYILHKENFESHAHEGRLPPSMAAAAPMPVC